MLRMCAEWRAQRAQQEKNWAAHDVASGWGYLEDTTSIGSAAADASS